MPYTPGEITQKKNPLKASPGRHKSAARRAENSTEWKIPKGPMRAGVENCLCQVTHNNTGPKVSQEAQNKKKKEKQP